MLGTLLPPEASVAEAFDDSAAPDLFPAEAALIEKAVEKRRLEFATGRRCARQALAGLGFAPGPLLVGKNREPLWPPGVVGSITHCSGYRAAAVAHDHDLASVGIDAEPNEPLPDGVLRTIGLDGEIGRLPKLIEADPAVCWDRLLFSAKESVYKAWYPLARRWLGFHEADLVFHPRERTFTATLLVPGPDLGGTPVTGFTGRFTTAQGLAITAVAVPTPA